MSSEEWMKRIKLIRKKIEMKKWKDTDEDDFIQKPPEGFKLKNKKKKKSQTSLESEL